MSEPLSGEQLTRLGERIRGGNQEPGDALLGQFPGCDLVDRRMKPTNGYRAVHIIVKRDRRRYEVQVRTKLQHLWATLVERMIGPFGIEIKYGGGPPAVQASLQDLSRLIHRHESLEPGAPDGILTTEIRARLDEINGILGE